MISPINRGGDELPAFFLKIFANVKNISYLCTKMLTMKIAITSLLLFVAFAGYCPHDSFKVVPMYSEEMALILAIADVESNGIFTAINHKERAHGLLQVRPIMAKHLGMSHEEMLNPLVNITAFLRFAEKHPGNAEQIARRWNGGLKGDQKKSTEKYWEKVNKRFKMYKSKNTIANV